MRTPYQSVKLPTTQIYEIRILEKKKKKKKKKLYFLGISRQWQISLVYIQNKHIKMQFNLYLKKMYEEYKNIVLIN